MRKHRYIGMGVGAEHRAPVPLAGARHDRDARRAMHNMSVRQYERLRRIIAKARRVRISHAVRALDVHAHDRGADLLRRRRREGRRAGIGPSLGFVVARGDRLRCYSPCLRRLAPE